MDQRVIDFHRHLSCRHWRQVMMLSTQIRLPHLRIGQQVLAGIVQPNAPGFQHITPVGQVQGLVGVLLYQEHGDAFLPKVADDLEDLFDDNRRQTQ